MEPVITGIITLVSAYMAYKSAIATAVAKQAPLPVQSDEAVNGERALAIVQRAADQGTEDQRQDLMSFERHPDRNKDELRRAIRELIVTNPALLTELQALLAKDTPSVSLAVEGSTVHGNVIGINNGQTITNIKK